MGGWEGMEGGLHPNEYAKQVCKEIGWPYSGNLTLLADCITSISYSNGVDVRGGFFLLMSRIASAKQQGIRIDRWFFQDGRYAELKSDIPPAPSPKPVESDRSVAEEAALLRAKWSGKVN